MSSNIFFETYVQIWSFVRGSLVNIRFTEFQNHSKKRTVKEGNIKVKDRKGTRKDGKRKRQVKIRKSKERKWNKKIKTRKSRKEVSLV